ncbi:hypothetical protein SPI_08805 [Niveomyces insectorum RCEF 264]|uniref:Uncharacterized protein n=1 Tax=Niveomyces insectorum RCEF 264 TaxID=1081102 RepID=A0A167MN30_9HYPO|nr:hypothetical protein SPI_08805 [Niveomyces insectorum RCEF 264]
MEERPSPILHVVYAGRGDAMYVEFMTTTQPQQQQQQQLVRKLFVMDGGPKGDGINGGGGGSSRPYWRFFLSAGRDIWYDQMRGPANQPIQLHAIVNSHPHADHIEGIEKLLQGAADYLRVDDGSGLILPAFDEEKPGAHIADLHKENAALFKGGTIEYPIATTDTATPIACITVTQGKTVMQMTQDDFTRPFSRIREYAQTFRKEMVAMNRSDLKDLNFASLLIHVPKTPNNLDGGIYLTGDNNGNIINHFMKTEAGQKRKFGIYKIQHHGSCEDNVLTMPPDRRFTASPKNVIAETTLMMTLIMAANPDDELLPDKSKKLASTIDALEGIKKLRTYFQNEVVKCTDDQLKLIVVELRNRHEEYKVKAGQLITPVYRKNVLIPIVFDPADAWTKILAKVEEWSTATETRKYFFMKKKSASKVRTSKSTSYPSMSTGYNPNTYKFVFTSAKEGHRDGGQDLGHDVDEDNDVVDATRARLLAQGRNQAQMEVEVAAKVEGQAEATPITHGTKLEWWRKWSRGRHGVSTNDNWYKLFKNVAKVTAIKDFFRSFEADAYVVSANYWQHKHPHTETLVGLAYALREDNRGATLYITNPNSFKYPAFAEMARELQLDPDALLRDNLWVRYPHTGHTMSLTPNPDVPMDVAQDATGRLRGADGTGDYVTGLNDIKGETRPLRPTDAVEAAAYVNRDARMEDSTKWDAVLRTAALVFTVPVVRNDIKTGQYLKLEDVGNAPNVTIARAATPLRVRQSWAVAANNNVNTQIIFRGSTTANPQLITTELVDGVDRLFRIRWGDHGFFYAAGAQDATLGRIDNSRDGLEEARFIFEPVVPGEVVINQMVTNSVPLFATMLMAPLSLPVRTVVQRIDALPVEVAAASNAATDDHTDGHVVGADGLSTTNLDNEDNDGDHVVDNNVEQRVANAVVEASGQNGQPTANTTQVNLRSGFDDFFAAARLDPKKMVTLQSLLVGMITEDNFAKLRKAQGSVEAQVMNFAVDYDSAVSWIEFTDDNLAVTVHGAELQLTPPPDALLSLNGAEPAPVVQAKVAIDLDVKYTLRVGLRVVTRTSTPDMDAVNTLATAKLLRRVAGPKLLAKALLAMGYSDVDLADMGIIEALGAVLGGHAAAVEMVYDRVPMALVLHTGFFDLKPDWQASTGQATYTPTGVVYIRYARIVCDLTGVNNGAAGIATALNLGGVAAAAGIVLGGDGGVSIESMAIHVENARMASEVVRLHAVVALGGGVDLQLAVTLSPTLDDDGNEEQDIALYFLMSSATSLGDLAGLFGKTSADFDGVALPAFADASPQHSLDRLDLSPGTLGFVLRQPLKHTRGVVLDRLFLNTDLDSWRSILPDGFQPSVFKNVTVQVDVLSPFVDRMRRVRVDVDFLLELPVQVDDQTTTVDVTARLAAIPLVRKGDYEYRLDIYLDKKGLSLSEIASLQGLQDMVAAIRENVPWLGDVLDGVHLRHVSAGIVEEAGVWSFSDWTADVWLPEVNLFPGAVALEDVSIRIFKIGTIGASIRTAIRLPDPVTAVWMDIRTPTRDAGGHLWLDVPEDRPGVSMQNVFDAFNVGTYDDVPLVGQILRTELVSLSLETGASVSGTPLSIDAFALKLEHPLLTIGPLQLNDVEFAFEMHYTTDEEGQRGAEVQVDASAYLFDDARLRAAVSYDGASNILEARLEPATEVTIGLMIDTCVADTLPGRALIQSVARNLQLMHSSIQFSTKDGLDVRHVDFHVADETTLEVQQIVLREVNVVYDVTELEASDDQQEPKPEPETAVDDDRGAAPADDTGVGVPDVTGSVAADSKTELNITAVLEKGPIKAKIVIRSADNGKKDKTLSFGIYPSVKDGLTLGDFLDLFSWTDASVDFAHPETYPRAFSMAILGADGELVQDDDGDKDDGDAMSSSVSTSSTTLSLSTFRVAAHTNQSIHVLTSPDIDILDIVIAVAYDAQSADPSTGTTGLSGILYGKIKIGDVLLEVSYVRNSQAEDETKEDVFLARASLADVLGKPYNADTRANGAGSLDMTALAASTSMPDDRIVLPEGLGLSKTMIQPNTIGARVRIIPAVKIDVWAEGDELWSGSVCGVTVTLAHLAVLFRYTQGAFQPNSQVRDDPAYEGYLRGQLDFKDFTAQAALSIGPERNATLVALLEKKSGDGSGSGGGGDVSIFEKVITEDMQIDGQGNSWGDMAPDFCNAMPFADKTKLFLYVDFKSKTIVFCAAIQDVGSVLLLGKDAVTDATTIPPKTVKAYVFFLEAKNLDQLWTETKEYVTDQFAIARVAVQVLGYDTTLKQLRDDVAVSLPDGVQQADEKALDPLNATPATIAMHLFEDMDETMTLKAGAWFIADLQVGSSTADNQQQQQQQQKQFAMTDVLSLDAANTTSSTTTPPRVRLYARVAKTPEQPQPGTEVDETVYGIDIRNLQIFAGAITLNGAGQYRPADKTLSVSATLQLQMPNDDQPAAPSQALLFAVELRMNPTETSFAMATGKTSASTIRNPFSGNMFNVQLERLVIRGASTRTADGTVERTCTIYGSALLGQDSPYRLLGLIYFRQGKPALGVVEFTRTIVVDTGASTDSAAPLPAMQDDEGQLVPLLTGKLAGTVTMTDVYANIIQPNAGDGEQPGSWPEDWDDFALDEAYMAYNSTGDKIVVGQRLYLPGFYVYGRFLLFSLPVSVSLYIKEKRKGFLLTGSYAQELDLGIIKFTSYTDGDRTLDGLSLTIDTSDAAGATYGVESGLKLLGFDNIYFKLQYQPSAVPTERRFEGMAKYNGNILGIDNPQVAFFYQNGIWGFSGWQLKRKAYWNADDPGDLPDGYDVLLDIDKAIEDASADDTSCGQLVDFAINEIVSMEFQFTLGLPGMKQTDMAEQQVNTEGPERAKGFKFTVAWSYSIRVKNTDIGTDIPLAEFEFVLPFAGFEPTFDGLLKYLWDKVLSEDNLKEIGTKLLEPATLGRLLGVMGVDQILPELIGKLICREPEGEPDTKDLKDRGKKDQDDKTQKKKDDLQDKKKDMDDIKDKSGEGDGDAGSSGTGGGGGGGGGGLPGLPGFPGFPGIPLPIPLPLPVPPIPIPIPIPPVPLPIPIPPVPVPVPLPLPLPLPFPTVDPTAPDTTPPDLPSWPTIGPDAYEWPYGTIGLLVLIKQYVETALQINAVDPEDVKKGIGGVLAKWSQWDLQDEIEKQYQDVGAMVRDAVDAGTEAKQAIQSRMNLQSDKAVTATFTPTDLESYIDVDVTAALPPEKWVHPEDYLGVHWQVYLSAQSTPPPPPPTAADPSQFVSFEGLARTLRCPAEAFRYVNRVYIWVRMQVVYQGYEFVSTDWATTTAVHLPWLPQPGAVQLFIEGTSTVAVALPPPVQPVGEWSIILMDATATAQSDQDPDVDEASVLYRTVFAVPGPGPGTCRVDIATFGYGLSNFGPRSVLARVRQLPWLPNTFHASSATDSSQTLPVSQAPKNLTARMVDAQDLVVACDAAIGVMATDYAVRLLRTDTQKPVSYVLGPASINNNRVVIRLSMETPVDGQQLDVIVSVKSNDTALPKICLLSKTSLIAAFPLEIELDKDSNYDQTSGVLSLALRASRRLDADATFTLHQPAADPGSLTTTLLKDNIHQTVHGNRAVLRMPWPQTDLDGSFLVHAVEPATGVEARSLVWVFPSRDAVTASIGTVTAAFTEDGGLQVSWDGQAEGVDVAITVLCETRPLRHLQQRISSAGGVCVFDLGAWESDNTTKPPPGETIIVFYVAKAVSTSKPDVVGQTGRLSLAMP